MCVYHPGKADEAVLEGTRTAAQPQDHRTEISDIERAAELLDDMPSLWAHSGVTNAQRQQLVREIFESVRVEGNYLLGVEPKAAYRPLFAQMLSEGVRIGRGDWIRTNGLVHPMHARYRTAPHPDLP